ncbi:hypothetical protein QDY72_00295 [Kingella negevensis]|uniref:hypothetical protein n=1 Tax=Kingella negevensis TaxID=1522312 RepID=UPI002542D805|nr:hypothetical protein [Kingella negevensis]MDK4683646.1 hypothetical protein [Kingella negevensis]MDK4708459.1 hypothetical protein [Kingella negevensis]MDK4710880.1 hypothetical protein [Kingella negevensis]WII92930.1 hypothetical protein QEO94_09905 [Kingella negevensis]
MPTSLCATRTRRTLSPCLIFILIHYKMQPEKHFQAAKKYAKKVVWNKSTPKHTHIKRKTIKKNLIFNSG